MKKLDIARAVQNFPGQVSVSHEHRQLLPGMVSDTGSKSYVFQRETSNAGGRVGTLSGWVQL